MKHPDELEEEAYAFSRAYPDPNSDARAMGYCCALYGIYGGDCEHVQDAIDTFEREAWEVDTLGYIVDQVDGRPMPPN